MKAKHHFIIIYLNLYPHCCYP